MSYWKPEFWPVLLGYPGNGVKEIREIIRTADQPCHLIAMHVPFRLYLIPRLKCVRLTSQHAAFTCDLLRRLAKSRSEVMPCLCAMSDTARIFVQSHRETLNENFLIYDTPDALLSALREAR